MESGTVKFFNNRPDKFFGFIETPNGDVFFHFNNGVDGASRLPQKGDTIFFEIGPGAKGPKATLWSYSEESLDFELRFRASLRPRSNTGDGVAAMLMLLAEKNIASGVIEEISSGRYLYHLQDIAELETMPQPLSAANQSMLQKMKAEASAFEMAKPAEAAAMQQRAKELATNV